MINENFKKRSMTCSAAATLARTRGGRHHGMPEWRSLRNRPAKSFRISGLLSGGEKALTAIALLFAMLNINPSPICLLDEIDAPLDDANVIRFSEYLQTLSKELQFIVITHRKPSMAICDTLYGIAMQEGVSDIVSVEL